MVSFFVLTCGGGWAGVMVRPLAVRALSSLSSGGKDLSKGENLHLNYKITNIF